MEDFLISKDESEEFFTAERYHIIELLHNHSTHPFSIARARVDPGVTTAWHQLKDTAEYYYILSGQGVMEIGENKSFVVRSGQIVTIPVRTPQRISNTDLEEDLIFLAICSPAFMDSCYEALE